MTLCCTLFKLRQLFSIKSIKENFVSVIFLDILLIFIFMIYCHVLQIEPVFVLHEQPSSARISPSEGN